MAFEVQQGAIAHEVFCMYTTAVLLKYRHRRRHVIECKRTVVPLLWSYFVLQMMQCLQGQLEGIWCTRGSICIFVLGYYVY